MYRQAGWQALPEQWVAELATQTPVRADIRVQGTAAEPITYCDVKVTHVIQWHSPTAQYIGAARTEMAEKGEAEKSKNTAQAQRAPKST